MQYWSLIFTALGALASIAAVIVSIVIYRRIPDKDVLSHRQRIRKIIKELKHDMDSGRRNYMLRIVDIDRFDKYYPEVFDEHPVQSYLKGELCGTDIKGIWIVTGLIGVKEKKGVFYPSNDDDCKTAKRLGLIPYSWIIDIDLDGDELEPSAIIYSKFQKHYPFSIKNYYLLGTKGQPVKKCGLVRKRAPFQQYAYFLLNATHTHEKEIFVKRDNPVYP